MAKRDIPLFIIDSNRTHKRGECDFLVCTDKDSGFIAKVDYIDGEKEEAGNDYRIGCPRRGVSLRIQILRITGGHYDAGSVRTLLKKGMDHFVKTVTYEVHLQNPSREECADFLDTLARMNMQYVDDAKADYTARQTALNSIAMLRASRDFLLKEDGTE